MISGPVTGQDLHIVALGGTQAPELPAGTNFNSRAFQRHSINVAGQVVFKSAVTGGRDVIYFGTPGDLSLVAIEDSAAPGTADATFCSFDMSNPAPSLIASADGKVAFAAKVLTPDQVDNCSSLGKVGIWVWEKGVAQLLALEGEQAADSAQGVIYSDIRPKFRHANGGTIFSATLYDTVSETELGRAILTGLPGALTIRARIGDPAPEPEGTNYAVFGNLWPHNNPATSAFWASLDGGGGQAIFRGDGNALALLWQSGGDASDFLPGYEFGAFAQIEPRQWGLNDAAAACFSTVVNKPDASDIDTIWRDRVESRAVIADTAASDPGIGDEFEFSAFNDCWINAAGRVLIRGTASSMAVVDDRRGLWVAGAPGEAAGLTFITSIKDVLSDDTGDYPVSTALLQPLEPHINSLGSVAFEVSVLDQQNQTRQSVWLVRGSDYFLIGLAGRTVQVDDQPRTLGPVLDFGVGDNGSGNQDGAPSALSDNDQLVFSTLLDGGAEAILVSPGRTDLIFRDGFEDPLLPP
jgi:hypothetical protein